MQPATYREHLNKTNPINMKTICSGVILTFFIATTGFSQSDSFIALKEKFAHHHNVFSFNTNSFWAGTIFWLAGEHEFYDAIERVKRISVITIPRDAFRAEDVSVTGFKKVMIQDSFYELARVKEHGDEITFYMKSTGSRDNRYMILVEDSENVTALELTGYIDPEFLLNCESHSYKEKS
jgi:hypothetical protein